MCDLVELSGGLTSLSSSGDLSPSSGGGLDEIKSSHGNGNGKKLYSQNGKQQNQVGSVMLFGIPIVSLIMDSKERLCLAQISSTLLKEFSYNEIHNRRVALGITCIQCTPVQLEILRRAGAMPVTSRRCGMITRREAERLCQSFLGDHAPPQLPENFAFDVYHECAWGCRGAFVPSRYNSSRAKCIRCSYCQLFFSPNKFIFHSHRLPDSRYIQPDAANFNSWRRHLKLCGDPGEPGENVTVSSLDDSGISGLSSSTLSSSKKLTISISTNNLSLMALHQIVEAWEDVKAMFNGGTRKRLLSVHSTHHNHNHNHQIPASDRADRGGKESKKSSQNKDKSKNSVGETTSSNAKSRSSQSPCIGTNQGSSQLQHDRDRQNHQIYSQNYSNSSDNFILPHGNPSSLYPGAGGGPSTGGIWNPGLNPSSSPRSIPSVNYPFGPFNNGLMSLPNWLHARRTLFPLSHPFGPTCPAVKPEEIQAGTGKNPVQSAFKPLVSPGSRSELFSFFGSTLPEDLSVSHSSPGSKISQNQNFSGKKEPTVDDSDSDAEFDEVDVEVDDEISGGGCNKTDPGEIITSAIWRLSNNSNANTPGNSNQTKRCVLSVHDDEIDSSSSTSRLSDEFEDKNCRKSQKFSGTSNKGQSQLISRKRNRIWDEFEYSKNAEIKCKKHLESNLDERDSL